MTDEVHTEAAAVYRMATTTYNPNGTVASTATTDMIDGDSTPKTTAYMYYPNGQQESGVGDAINATFDIYDKAGNLVNVYQPQVLNNAGTSQVYPETTYAYDTAGNETSQTDANGNTTTYAYDENGNMLSETLPDGSNVEFWTYNQFGQVATHTDFDGNVATYTYNSSGVHAGLVQQVVYTGSGKTTQAVIYGYDNMNRQQTVGDLTGTTTYSYDANNNIIEENTPEGIIQYGYNKLNQHTSTWTDTTGGSGGGTTLTTYSYDNLGRLNGLSELRLNNSAVSLNTFYAYDGNGNKVYESDPNGDVTTYSYDALNRLTGETVAHTSGGTTTILYSVEYTLNHDGTRATALEAMKQSAGTTLYTFTDWTYDGEARLIDESVTNITTSSFNLPSGYILSSAFSQGMTWDNANAFTTSGVTEGNITTIEGAVLFDPSAGTKYGGNGNEWVLVTDAGVGKLDVTSFTLSYAGTFTRDDVLNPKDYTTATTFALSGSPTGYNNAYSYDLVGNRTKDVLTGSEDGTAGTTTYSYNGDNELTQTVNGSVTTNYGYDDNGSQTSVSVGTTTTALYSYDVRNRLQKVVNSGGTTTYVYDDAGDRVQETTGTTTTYYLIDTQNPSGYSKPIEVRVGSATGTPTTTYILGQSVIGQANSSGAVSYLLIDGREDTRALVNSSGTVTATFSYDDFGNPVGFTMSSAPTEFLFQQSMFDAPSGLNILGDGQREEQVGQDSFIERDPNGYSNNDDPLTLNGYLFDGANPITNIDLNGHDFDYITILATAGISAALMGTLSGGLAALSGRNVIYNSVVGIGGGLALTSAFFDGQLPKVAANAIVVTAMTTLLLGFLDYEFKGPNFVKSHITTYESVAVETFSWASISEAWFPASSYTSLDGTKDPQVGKLLQDITLAFGQTFAEGVALLGDVAGLATGAISNATAKSELTDAFKTIAGNLLSTGISLAVDTLFMSSFGGEVPSDVKSGIFTDLKGGLISNSLSAGISDICSELADLIVDKVAG